MTVQHQEDRMHMWQSNYPGAPSNRWSKALGQDMPTSRQERRIIEKQRGIEFCSPSDSVDAQASKRYAEAIASGCSREQADKESYIPPKPAKPLRERIKEWEHKARPKMDDGRIRWDSNEDRGVK